MVRLIIAYITARRHFGRHISIIWFPVLTQNVSGVSENMADDTCNSTQSTEINEKTNGLLTGNGTRGVDETDLAASRQSTRKYARFQSQRVHLFWDIFAALSILTFVADIVTDLVVSVLYYFDGLYWRFSLTLGFVILSSIVMQVFSAKWFHEDDEKQNWCAYLLHLFHLGPLVR